MKWFFGLYDDVIVLPARMEGAGCMLGDGIAITVEAFEAIKATLPVGSVGYERERAPDGKVLVWLDARTIDQLRALRDPGDDYSDAIIRLAATEGAWPQAR